MLCRETRTHEAPRPQAFWGHAHCHEVWRCCPRDLGDQPKFAEPQVLKAPRPVMKLESTKSIHSVPRWLTVRGQWACGPHSLVSRGTQGLASKSVHTWSASHLFPTSSRDKERGRCADQVAFVENREGGHPATWALGSACCFCPL